MDNKATGFLLIVLAAVLFLLKNSDFLPGIDIKPNIVPAVTVPEPCRPAIEAIRSMRFDRTDAAELARFYANFARVVEGESGLVGSSEEIRILHAGGGMICLEDRAKKYTGFSGHADEAIAQSIGSKRHSTGFDPVSLDVTKRKNLAQALRAIAWAVQQ